MKKQHIFLALIIVSVIALVIWKRKPIMDKLKTYTRAEFLKLVSPMAIVASKGTGLFPSVMLAQAILESGNGNSSLSKDALNFFGIKADDSWTSKGGPYVEKDTAEYINGKKVMIKAKFRKYDSILTSFIDRTNFLQRFPRYTNAGVFDSDTPEAQAKALLKAGYATDPEYANKLITLIKTNNLKMYDENI